MNVKQLLYFLISSILYFHISTPVSAFGTFSEGWMVAKLIQFESRGIIYESYEGILELTYFEPLEDCEAAKDECFTPVKKKAAFSVRPENANLVNFLSKNLNQTILVQYRIHRIKAISLSTDREVVDAQFQENILPKTSKARDPKERLTVWIHANEDASVDKFVDRKTGGKRNFSVVGRILSLEYKGTLVGTYEGLYLDESRGKVHPFSVTSEEMAGFALKALKYNGKYYLGISVAYVSGLRESDYDLFEINFKAPAGALEGAQFK
ncbi:hypothetical protein LEP1GSC050_1672 [Leptospira broomii serovar Hurstbridge str. 5399]|uniref:Uncharacterized protein n=1 Tax=Leptospira broomii serovar Hurstbridge str. 5399 TaxID=1049789 RepID=T0F6V2_9LEPT|nr:hypothetical protein [Leptospira broomii]EQA43252.1 hypothetical protein LEP1GSC050_1672 [Leptospira broomii serovar Hurstbridge str. 5399]